MFKKILLTGLTLSLAGPSIADVKIALNDDVELLLVNAYKPEIEGGFFSSNKSVVLPDGENQIAFRYIPTFKTSKDREQFTSDVIVAKFNAADTELQFELPEYRHLRDAEKFNPDTDWKLVNADGQQVTVVQDKLIHNGLQIGRDYEEEIARYNAKGRVASVATTGAYIAVPVQQAQQAALAQTATQTAAVGSTTATTTAAVATTTVQPTTEEAMLHFWYGKADEASKQRFKAFVNSQ
jgi:uncharacterized protein YccT (UPF0319 family)